MSDSVTPDSVTPDPATSNAASSAAADGASRTSADAAGAPETFDTPQMPTSQPVLLRALRWGSVVTVALVVVFAGIGWLVSQQPGLWGGLIGPLLGGVFLMMTVGSIAFANRYVDSPSYITIFFAVVLGSWVLKFVLFIVVVILLRDQPWLDTRILFFGVIASVIASLVLDVVIIAKSRIPVISNN